MYKEEDAKDALKSIFPKDYMEHLGFDVHDLYNYILIHDISSDIEEINHAIIMWNCDSLIIDFIVEKTDEFIIKK